MRSSRTSLALLALACVLAYSGRGWLSLAYSGRGWLFGAPLVDPLRLHEPGDDVSGCPTELVLRNYTGDLTGILTSYPRSGNSLVRMLVQRATGYPTVDLYCDKELSWFQSECRSVKPFLMKCAHPANAL